MKIQLDLTARQERQLIQLGLAALANDALGEARPKASRQEAPKKKQKWTAGQRRKFLATMSKKWEEKRGKKPGRKPKPNGKALHTSGRATRRALLDARLSLDEARVFRKELRDRTHDAKLARKAPRKPWSDAHRKNFLATMAKKRADGWVPKRTRGAQK